MSLSSCLALPHLRMLRAQLLLRLQAVAEAAESGAEVATWWRTQAARCLHELSAGEPIKHMVTRSPSLEQAGGLHRMTLRGHAGPVGHVQIVPGGSHLVTASADGTAQARCFFGGLSAALARPARPAARPSAHTRLGPPPPARRPSKPSNP